MCKDGTSYFMFLVEIRNGHLKMVSIHSRYSLLPVVLSILILPHRDLRYNGKGAPMLCQLSANYLPPVSPGKNSSKIPMVSWEAYPHSTELSASTAAPRLR